MNNEEAIEILQNISKVYRQFTEKEIEALNMAINALSEHLDAENNYNSSKIYDKMQDSATKVDLVSRKAVEVCNSCKNYGKFCGKCNFTDDSVYEYYERQ